MKFAADRLIDHLDKNLEFNWESNTWNLGLNYRFGGGKYRAKSRKRRDNDEKEGGGIFIIV